MKSFFAAFFLCLAVGIAPSRGLAQVAPAAKVGGLPINVGFGISNYDLDYGQDRRMSGVVGRAGISLFHGMGVDVSARSIFMFTPDSLTRMEQNTFLAGVYYEAPLRYHFRPFARFAGGLGTIEFPSDNPYYTRDSRSVLAPSGGIEVPVYNNKVFVRAEYEYQFWRQYQGPHDLNPNGITVGVSYYLRGPHRRDR